MNDLSLVISNQNSYFDEFTSPIIKKKFVNKMFSCLLPKLFLIFISLIVSKNRYIELFIDSQFADGLFIIIFYVLLISTAFLYCNFHDISSYDDIKPYYYVNIICFSYILPYLSFILKTSFFIYLMVYLLFFNLVVILYTYQQRFNFDYSTLIKISFTSEFIIFIILSIFNNINYFLSIYLTSSIITLYILWNTENIITSSNRTFNLKVNEYYLGPILIYLDIFNIFPFIIKLFSGR